MQPGTFGRSVLNGVAVVVAASLFGLFGLPIIFGNQPDTHTAIAWLVVAIATCVCLLLPTRLLAKALAILLMRLPRRGRHSETTRQATFEVAELLVAATYLVLLQAIVRHPLVAVLGTDAEPFLIEAVFGILALLALLLLLTWIYRAARPLVEGMAWVALDVTFATTSSEEATRTANSMAPVVTSTVAAYTPARGARTETAVLDALPGARQAAE
jgi:hypothetical protein